MTIEIKTCKTDEEIMSTFLVMKQLRPALSEATYVEMIRKLEKEGYTLVALYDGGVCYTVAGFRKQSSLFRNGDTELYVNDLVTDTEKRGQGYGHEMMEWLKAAVKELGCVAMTLDSGNQRQDAHKFYAKEGMLQPSLHFNRPRSPDAARKVISADDMGYIKQQGPR